jgi:pentatricopeptide repeat protein
MNKGMCPDIVFFSSIINNLCKLGRVMDAQNIFDLTVNVGLHPTVAMHSTLMVGTVLLARWRRHQGYLMLWCLLALNQTM